MKDNKFYLIHISECIADIFSYVEDGYDDFMGATKTQDAVIRKLQIMAESTLRLPDDLKSQHPEVNWKDIRGFRNVVVHDYTDVDLNEVWKIVKNDLPVLKTAVEAMMRSLEQSDNSSSTNKE